MGDFGEGYFVSREGANANKPPMELIYSPKTYSIHNDEEAHMICYLIWDPRGVFTPKNMTLPTSRLIVYAMIPKLLEYVQQPRNDFRKLASLKALNDLLINGDDDIAGRILENRTLGNVALDILKSHSTVGAMMQNLSAMILVAIFEKDIPSRDDLLGQGFLEALVDTGTSKLGRFGSGPVGDINSPTNFVWGVQKLLGIMDGNPKFEPGSIKLFNFMELLIHQSFEGQLKWTKTCQTVFTMALDTLTQFWETERMHTMVWTGIQKILEESSQNVHPPNYPKLEGGLYFYFIHYTHPTHPYPANPCAYLMGEAIRTKRVAFRRNLFKNFGTFLRELDTKKFMDLHPLLRRLFHSMSMFPLKFLLEESRCCPYFVHIFSCGVKDEAFHLTDLELLNLIQMVDSQISISNLEMIRHLWACGLPEAINGYRQAYLKMRDESRRAFDRMLEQLVTKLTKFKEFDLIQDILWPQPKFEFQ